MLPHAVAIPWSLPRPVVAFTRLAGRPGVFWLDSSAAPSPQSRFSMLGCEPRWVFSARNDTWTLCRADRTVEHGAAGAIEQLDLLLDHARVAPPIDAPELPFFGGAVGWLAYELGRQFEPRAGNPGDGDAERSRPGERAAAAEPVVPDLRFAWYDAAAVYDHLTGGTWLVAVGGDRTPAEAIQALAAALGVERREGLAAAGADEGGKCEMSAAPCSQASASDRGVEPLRQESVEARSNLSAAEYMARVESVREGIARGEFYQLNLVQRFTCPMSTPPAETYRRLRTVNPAPFAAFIADEAGAVLCSSPERFLEVTPAGRIRTCPIKGTRPRGTTPVEDAALQDELRASDKERAELLMIVDLMRNDLGRVCVPGSVVVTRLHALESFATVHHLVGEVTGQLRPGVSRRELLRAVFPGGSITGAPKISAMRAIEALEPDRRGIAMGSVGYFSAHGRTDLNIAIRTIIARAGVAQVSVGAGIVWDSDPAAEYAETITKAAALFTALGAQPA